MWAVIPTDFSRQQDVKPQAATLVPSSCRYLCGCKRYKSFHTSSYLELDRLHELLALSYKITTELGQTSETSLCYFWLFAVFIYCDVVERARIWDFWALVSWFPSPHLEVAERGMADTEGVCGPGRSRSLVSHICFTACPPSTSATVAISTNPPPQPPTATKQTDNFLVLAQAPSTSPHSVYQPLLGVTT